MSKELDEFYKSYSARIIVIDDTPSVEVMDGGKFKLLGIEEYEEMTNKLAELEAKLAESEKERELDNSFWKQECDGLQKALAEKTLTIEQINKAFIGNRSLWKGKYERANQDKISLALEQLEKVKENIKKLPITDYDFSGNFEKMYKQDAIRQIDNQIKQLKEGK